MHLSTLPEWLNYISNIHPFEMDLGLERVRAVGATLGLLKPPCTTIIVGGTNGKGSTVFALEAIYRAGQYRVGCFTSPFLFRFNEEVRINGRNAEDEEFCNAFAKIEAARGDITLTPFEYHTLAALLIMKAERLDVMILEVGLGGRLDAVNIIDADVSIVTTISLDHVAILGKSREKIGVEKAGIFRKGKPAISGDFDPPLSLEKAARECGARFYSQTRDFGFIENEHDWTFLSESPEFELADLPRSNLATQNLASALMAILLLQNDLPVNNEDVVNGIKNIDLRGRIEVSKGIVTHIYDVAHNPASCERLATYLKKNFSQKTIAVFSMLQDKDILTCIHLMKEVIDEWHVAPLTVKRAASIDELQKIFAAENIAIEIAGNIKEAYENATHKATRHDRIVMFGSFHVVSEVLKS